MKIKGLEMVGFGHWRDYTVALDDHLTVVFGNNEAGKTTLYHFIRTILFGFPSKKKNSRDYTPKDGGSFGGHLVVDHPEFGLIRISRFKGVNRNKATLTSLEDSTQLDLTLEELLSPLTETVFKEVYTLEQQQLVELNHLSEGNLQELLLVIGLAGSRQLIDQQQSWYDKSQALYKVKGYKPILNAKLAEYRELTTKLMDKKGQEQHYQTARIRLKNLVSQSDELTKKLALLEEQVIEEEGQLNNYPKLEEYRFIMRRLTEEQEHHLSPEDYQQFQLLKSKFEELAEEKKYYENQRASVLSHEPNHSAIKFYMSEENGLEELASQQVFLETKLEKLGMLKERLLENETLLQSLMADISLPTPQENVDLFVIGEEPLEELKKLATEEQSINKAVMAAQKTYEDDLLKDSSLNKRSRDRLKKLQRLWGLPAFLGLLTLLLRFLEGRWLLPLILITGITVIGVGIMIFTQLYKSKSSHKKLETQMSLIQSKEALEEATAWSQDFVREKAQLARRYHFHESQPIGEWLYQIPLRHHVGEIASQTRAYQKEIKGIEVELESMEGAFDKYRDWIPTGLDLSAKMSHLLVFLNEMKEKVQGLGDNNQQENWRQALKQVETNQLKVVAELQALSPVIDEKNLASFEEKQKELQQLELKLIKLKQEISECFDLENESNYNFETLERSFKTNKEGLFQLRRKFEVIEEGIRDCRFSIQQSEADGTLAMLYQEQADLEDELTELGSEWASFLIANSVVDRVLNQLSTQRLPALLKTTSLFLSRLTLGQYRHCDMIDDQLVISNSDGVCYYLNELSTGTRDQLYLALRLGFIELHQGVNLAPLIIDDGWLHYDSQRKAALFHVLKELSAFIQVICITSDQELMAFAEGESVEIEHL